MKQIRFVKFTVLAFILMTAMGVSAQTSSNPAAKSREVSDADGIPVLVKHLPDWETAQKGAAYIMSPGDLKNALGEKKVFDSIDFAGGTEAVTAVYPQGKLLLVEFSSPQSSIDADNQIQNQLNENGQNFGVAYRRIGNYSAFVFDTNDDAAANALLDQIKYEKTVQWLGSDPFALKRAERDFIEGTSSLFLSTVKAIVSGIGLAVFSGLLVGFFYYRFRKQKRSQTQAFSDAGGMTRLNLDELTSSTSTDRLLKD